MKKETNHKTMKYAQGCDSKVCIEKYKKDLIRDECPTTVHEIDFTTKEKKCLECNKISKYRG